MSGHIDNYVDIEAPMSLVWDMTNDVENWAQLFSEYSVSEILRRDGDTLRIRLALHPDENGTVYGWVSDRTPDPIARTARSMRVEPGPFKYMFLFWEYTETGTGVRLRWVQDFEMKPNAPVDDAGMTRHLNDNSIVQMELIRDKVQATARVATSA